MRNIIFSNYFIWLFFYAISVVFSFIMCVVFTIGDTYFVYGERGCGFRYWWKYNYNLFIKSLAYPSRNNFNRIKLRILIENKESSNG